MAKKLSLNNKDISYILEYEGAHVIRYASGYYAEEEVGEEPPENLSGKPYTVRYNDGTVYKGRFSK